MINWLEGRIFPDYSTRRKFRWGFRPSISRLIDSLVDIHFHVTKDTSRHNVFQFCFFRRESTLYTFSLDNFDKNRRVDYFSTYKKINIFTFSWRAAASALALSLSACVTLSSAWALLSSAAAFSALSWILSIS